MIIKMDIVNLVNINAANVLEQMIIVVLNVELDII